MSYHDIQQHIITTAQAQAQQIVAQAQEQAEQLIATAKESAQSIRKQILSDREPQLRAIDQSLRQEQAHRSISLHETARSQALRATREQALTELHNLSSADHTAVLTKLVGTLPAEEKGSIRVGTLSASLIKPLLDKTPHTITGEIEGEAGFIYESDTSYFDARFSSLLQKEVYPRAKDQIITQYFS